MSSQVQHTGHTPEVLAFTELFAAEQRHFWFRSRNRVLGAVVRRLVADLPDGYRVLEVGCGTGNVLQELERVCEHGEVTGLDLFEEGLRYARLRVRCRVVQADLHDMPFREPFHLVGLFDVLEHVPDDAAVLRDLFATLRPGGHLLMTVPAHMWLWSDTDVFAEHYRRYSPAQLRQALEQAGFEVSYLTQFMLTLAPLMWLARRWAAWRGRQATPLTREQLRPQVLRELRIVPGLNALLTALLGLEAPFIARGARLPLGTSLLAIARRP